jgi:hypothetical protein
MASEERKNIHDELDELIDDNAGNADEYGQY